MDVKLTVKPLSRNYRRLYFGSLLFIFVVAVPFLLLYATGYRFHNGTDLISTGGVYVGADSSGSEIFINNELVRETRTFRRGFYAQNLEPGIHRVHVQKEDHHTWVKELSVSPHRVTEAQAFNIPLEPEVREIPRFRLVGGELLFELSTSTASTTALILASTTASTTQNIEYAFVMELFATTSATSTENEPELGEVVTVAPDALLAGDDASNLGVGTTTEEVATTTKISDDIKLFERGGDLFAAWAGSEEEIPYYFCNFSEVTVAEFEAAAAIMATTTEVVQTCRDEIRMEDFYGREIFAFDFFPGNNDLVVLALEDGIYVEEIDDRGWQNIQPLYLKEGLDLRVHDGNIYARDGVYLLEINIEE